MTTGPSSPQRRVWSRAALRAVPAGIWALGLVSMLMDISSEMIHALLPVYLVGVLGASAAMVGMIEGVAEATASITKVFSGALSDWFGRRKILAVAGYGLAACSKPVFPIAPSIGWLFAARFVDRVGKGIRGAPRDALIAEIAPAAVRGASFGLRQSLDTVGAFIGPLVAMALMAWSGDRFRVVFWVAVAPAFFALALIVFAVREPRQPARERSARFPLRRAELARLGRGGWTVIAVATVFMLSRFSEAFLVLRAQALGLPLALVPLVLVVMNVVYALAAYPAGAIADRRGRRPVLAIGVGLLVAADLVLAVAPGIAAAAIGVALWGLHMGFTQGLFATLVADHSPPALRGTAFGMFNLLTGGALLAANLLAGVLSDALGASAMFVAGAGLAALSLLALALLPPERAPTPAPGSISADDVS